jgi:hypothetical protein
MSKPEDHAPGEINGGRLGNNGVAAPIELALHVHDV